MLGRDCYPDSFASWFRDEVGAKAVRTSSSSLLLAILVGAAVFSAGLEVAEDLPAFISATFAWTFSGLPIRSLGSIGSLSAFERTGL